MIDPSGTTGVFVGGSAQASIPFLTGGGNALVVGGNNEGYVQIVGAASANLGNYSLGASAGRGLTFGFFRGDINDFLSGSSLNVDTEFGGLSMLFNQSGSPIGFAFSEPSFGFSVNGTGGSISPINPSVKATWFSSEKFDHAFNWVEKNLRKIAGQCP